MRLAASFPWGSGSSRTGMKGCQGHIDIAPSISTRMLRGLPGNGGTGAGRWEMGGSTQTPARLGLRRPAGS